LEGTPISAGVPYEQLRRRAGRKKWKTWYTAVSATKPEELQVVNNLIALNGCA
jgi:hypothetical protein